MRTLSVCLLLVAPAVALEWSDPVPFYNDTFTLHGPSCCVGAGETLWIAYTAGRHTALTDKFQVHLKWSARGEAWSDPITVTGWDSTNLYSDPGIGCDAQGRLWVSWYQGEYPAPGCEPQNSAIWTVMRDTAGLHEPVKAFEGFAHTTQSFSHDPEGNWYLGFEEQTPFTDLVYSSAMYVRLLGDTWSVPHAISRGCGEPIHTNMYLPKLVPRHDRGIWSVNEMNLYRTSEYFGLLKSVRGDTVRSQTTFDGQHFVAALDSTGHLWVVYFMLAGYRLLTSVELVSGVPVDTEMIYNLGGSDPFICADTSGAVWVLWTRYGDELPVVSFSDGHGWTSPERAGYGNGPAKGLLPVHRNAGVMVLFESSDGHYYSTIGTPGPGAIENQFAGHSRRLSATICRDVLVWSAATPSLRNVGDTAFHSRPALLDACGRTVIELQPGENDIRHLAPGIYYVRGEGPRGQEWNHPMAPAPGSQSAGPSVRKIVVQH